MATSVPPAVPQTEDPVSNVLKWILLVVAIGSFGLFAWATVLTYERAPPQPERFVTSGGATLMTGDDILAGKGGFQKADLMDYGSLYGMGSYFGQDYTAFGLMRLATLTENGLAQTRFGKAFDALSPEQQAAVRNTMREQLQRVDLTRQEVVVPDALAGAITALRADLAANLGKVDLVTGWTPAYSLDQDEALHTADFLIYSALTTVARRPDVSWSWTENWPYEPEVGNTPTSNTFVWTWASFCFTFLCFGLVLFIYEFWLNHPDDAPMDPVLARFGPLTESQRKVGKYFLVVAAVLLLQILAGTIMAHAYYDRRSFYGLNLHEFLPFNFLRDVHIQAPIIWIGVGWIGAGLFLAPAIAGGREARGQGLLVDVLFWVTLAIVAGALIGNWLGIMGYIQQRLVLVRQPGTVLHPARPVLADRLLPRPADLERPGLPRAVANRRRGVAGDPPVLVGAHPNREPDLGRHDQHRHPLRIWHDPADRHREVVHHRRFLAVVGGASVGRAVVRVLRRQHERLPADGGRPGVAQAGRAGGLLRADPDLPWRRARHRASPLLGRRTQHVGAAGQHVLVHRGAAAGAAGHRGDPAVPADPRARRRSTTRSPTPTSSARRSGTSSAPGCSAAAR